MERIKMSILEDGVHAFKAKDFAKTLEVLKPLAEEGDAEAQCIVATIYHLGLGTDQDCVQAIKWYTKSAEQGYAVAANNLAGIYWIGDCNVDINREKATRLYQLSNELGFPTAIPNS
jgi:TPR repeat protein